MRNRKLWAAILAAVMILTMTGCGKKPGNTIEDSTSETTVSENIDTEESGEGQTESSSDEAEDITSDDTEGSDDEDTESTDKVTDEATSEPDDSESESAEKPTTKPIVKPVVKPTEAPTTKPTVKPTEPTTTKPTVKPTEAPTTKPTVKPTEPTTTKPTVKPTEAPTAKPTEVPTVKPTEAPTAKPTEAPTKAPATRTPIVVTKPVSTYPEIQQGYSDITEADILTVRSIISSILYTDMSTIEKVKTVHDYLVKSTTYDTSYYSKNDSHEHLSNILNEKRAVCQGYAVAFYVFMNELDIQCLLVSGYAGEDHAWNAVKMDDGKWYFVDVTWDDPIINGSSSYPNGDNLSYTYFLCTNSFISRSHTAEEYIGVEPASYGTSNEYNNYPYYQMGYKGVYRINTAADLSCVSQMTESGEYMFIRDSEAVDVQTIMDKIDEYIHSTGRGASYGFQYGSASVMATINYTT